MPPLALHTPLLRTGSNLYVKYALYDTFGRWSVCKVCFV